MASLLCGLVGVIGDLHYGRTSWGRIHTGMASLLCGLVGVISDGKVAWSSSGRSHTWMASPVWTLWWWDCRFIYWVSLVPRPSPKRGKSVWCSERYFLVHGAWSLLASFPGSRSRKGEESLVTLGELNHGLLPPRFSWNQSDCTTKTREHATIL